jgi:hypothetical protein
LATLTAQPNKSPAMTPLLPSLLAALSLSCFVAPVSRADDAETLKQLREENAALRAKLETPKGDVTGKSVVIGRKTPPDLAGLDIFGSVACDLESPPPSGTPEQLKSLKDWRMNLLGEWNAKARAAIARGVSSADVARWKISLHWTQVDVGNHLISIVCHVSEETDGSSPSGTVYTFNFIDRAARPVPTAVLLSGDAALPALRTLLEKHKLRWRRFRAAPSHWPHPPNRVASPSSAPKKGASPSVLRPSPMTSRSSTLKIVPKTWSSKSLRKSRRTE